MTKSEQVFHQIAKEIPEASEGKMFGALCIKTVNGKAAAILWQGSMLFKLNEESQLQALKLKGAKKASHLYDNNKAMKGWITIREESSDKWIDFTMKAIKFLNDLENRKRDCRT